MGNAHKADVLSHLVTASPARYPDLLAGWLDAGWLPDGWLPDTRLLRPVSSSLLQLFPAGVGSSRNAIFNFLAVGNLLTKHSDCDESGRKFA